jgi:hypothetical protein
VSSESSAGKGVVLDGRSERRYAEFLRRLQQEADEFRQDLTPRVAHRGWHQLLHQAQAQTSALVDVAAASFSSAVAAAYWQALLDLIQNQIFPRGEPASAFSLPATEPLCNSSEVFFNTSSSSFAASIEACWQLAGIERLREFYELAASPELRIREIFGRHLRSYRRRLRSIYGSAAATCQRRCALAGGSITRNVRRPRSGCRTLTTASSADDDDASSSFPHNRALGLERKGRQRAPQSQITQDHHSPRSPATSRPGRPTIGEARCRSTWRSSVSGS